MKKICSIFLCFVMIFAMAVPAFAKEEYSYIDTLYGDLYFDRTWGIANCVGTVESALGNELEVELTLRKLVDGDWVDLYTWTDTGTYRASANGRYAVARGYTYQIYVTAYVYDANGWIVESASDTYEEFF